MKLWYVLYEIFTVYKMLLVGINDLTSKGLRELNISYLFLKIEHVETHRSETENLHMRKFQVILSAFTTTFRKLAMQQDNVHTT
jgi:hypothetical protein